MDLHWSTIPVIPPPHHSVADVGPWVVVNRPRYRDQRTLWIVWWLLQYKLSSRKSSKHDDVIKWRHFPRYWSFVRGIHRWPMGSPHKSKWRGALMFSLICAWTNSWANNRDTGDLRRYWAHNDVTVTNTTLATSGSPRAPGCRIELNVYTDTTVWNMTWYLPNFITIWRLSNKLWASGILQDFRVRFARISYIAIAPTPYSVGNIAKQHESLTVLCIFNKLHICVWGLMIRSTKALHMVSLSSLFILDIYTSKHVTWA